MNTSTLTNVDESSAKIQALIEQLQSIMAQKISINNEEDLIKLEENVQIITNQIRDLVVAKKVQEQLEEEQFRSRCLALVKGTGKSLVNKGLVTIQVRFAGGTVVALRTAHGSRKGSAGKKGKGLYPGLYLLGIHDHCTPFLASEIAQMCAALCSIEEAQNMLEARGCFLNTKSIRNIMKRFAARARAGQRGEDVLATLQQENLQGRHVVVSTDGGRCRIRKTKRGPRTAKKRKRYSTDWREPKLLIIYVVDENGRMDKHLLPLIDGTLKGPDMLFGLLYGYFLALDLSGVSTILFIADGAPWIWESVSLARAMLKAKQVKCIMYELIDFYHVVQHLHAFARLKRKWSEKQRKQWVSRQTKLLKSGEADQVLDNLQTAAKGSKSKLLIREKEYFVKNRQRLGYKEMSELKMPIGSGAIESAIRRVVNLRLKSSCIF